MNYDHKMYCHLFMVHSIKCANCQPQCFACQWTSESKFGTKLCNRLLLRFCHSKLTRLRMFRIVGLCSEFFTFSLFHFIRACRRRSRNLFSGPPLGLIIIQNVCSLYIYYFVGYFVCANSRSQSQAPSKQGILIERLLFIYPPSKRLHSLVVNSFALAKKNGSGKELRAENFALLAFLFLHSFILVIAFIR